MNNTKKSQTEKRTEEINTFFRELFTFTDHGKLKSMDFMYSMVFGFVILFVYFFASHFITLAMESLFPTLQRPVLNMLDIMIPAILATGLFCAVFFVIKKKYLLLWGYIIALLLILFVIVFMLLRYQPETKSVILPVVIYIFFIPVAFGALCLFLLAYLHHRKNSSVSMPSK